MAIPQLPREVVLGTVAVVVYLVFRTEQAGVFTGTRNLWKWLAAGAALALSLALLIRNGFVFSWPLSAILALIWAAPLIELALFRSRRLMTRASRALDRGDYAAAETILLKAEKVVDESSPVDLDWNRIQLGQLAGRLSMARDRHADAIGPLKESYRRALEFGVPCYILESGELLAGCYCALEQWEEALEVSQQLVPLWRRQRGHGQQQMARMEEIRDRIRAAINLGFPARRASDSAASVPSGPMDTTSSRTL